MSHTLQLPRDLRLFASITRIKHSPLEERQGRRGVDVNNGPLSTPPSSPTHRLVEHLHQAIQISFHFIDRANFWALSMK